MMELRRLVRRLRTALHHGGRGVGSEQWSARLVVVANTAGPVGAQAGGGEPPPVPWRLQTLWSVVGAPPL